MAQKTRKPKVGDIVTVIGHDGTFEVVRIDDHVGTADLRPQGTETILTGVLGAALRLKPREDVNQAAARIVIEAMDSK